jgi:choline dehydrogenase-like flavoprotein
VGEASGRAAGLRADRGADERSRDGDGIGRPRQRIRPDAALAGLGEHKLSVTHPLGGCRIGATSEDGVVDAHGRVYDGSLPAGSTEVHPGLFIVDASVFPGAVVAHPTLTIMAQALKTMDRALAPA